MTNQIAVQNEKQLVAGINKAIGTVATAKKGYINSVILLGEKLIEAKKIVPYGYWEGWVKDHFEWSFGRTQAQKYMLIANNKLLVLEYFEGENSIDQLTKSISEASPEQLEKVEQLKLVESIKPEKKEKSAKPAALRIVEEAIDADFVEVEHEEDQIETLTDIIEYLKKDNQALSEEVDILVKVFDANDQVTTAMKEVKRMQELNRVLKISLDGSMTSENAAKREAKYWKSMYDKLVKERE